MGFFLTIDGKRQPVDSVLPLLPLRDTVLFPGSRVPLFIGRPSSVAAISRADSGGKLVFAVAQKRPEVSSPRQGDLYGMGTIGILRQTVRLPDGTMRILLAGICRARLVGVRDEEPLLLAETRPDGAGGQSRPTAEPMAALVLSRARAAFLEYGRQETRISQDDLLRCLEEADPAAASYLMASLLNVSPVRRQELLEAEEDGERLDHLARILEEEARTASRPPRRDPLPEILPVPEVRREEAPRPRRRGPVRESNEFEAELEELSTAVERSRMPRPVAERARREIRRLSKMTPLSPEATVVRGYIDWLVALPWRRRSRDRHDLARAQAILDAEHFGLHTVKDRICEQIAVMKLSRRVRGPVLCLTGPPGVGKTSLGRSIARSLNRRFVRMSLGGLRDEAELRGHRRTYVGALPGRIIQAMKRAGTVNPVILLDEVDKLGMDFRGDPAAALLEVLDPEQNHAFSDHYLEVDYDLSHVLFLTTANNVGKIPPALRDRMEVIPLPGYLETEKLAIASRFLLPRQRQAAGIAGHDLDLPDTTLSRIIREYTREAGVRGLEREIARLCRRAARTKASGGEPPHTVRPSDLESLLGIPPFVQSTVVRRDRVGIATGLAWSETGGSILTIEVGVLPGRGRLLLTGRLGATLRESARAALSCVRARADRLSLDRDFYRNLDIHLHIPEGEVPKDGPSAGAAIAVALVSALTGRPSRDSVAVTGEITLTGRILPVGGLGEKLLAALRAGARTVLIPADNQRQVADLPHEILDGLEVVPVMQIDQVLRSALVPARRLRADAEALAQLPLAGSVSAAGRRSAPAGPVSTAPSEGLRRGRSAA